MTVFWFWIFGGSISKLYNNLNDKLAIPIVTVLSSPGLGFMLSTVYRFIGEKITFLNRNMYKIPDLKSKSNIRYFQLMIKHFTNEPGIIFQDGEYKEENAKILYKNHQVLLRDKAVSNEVIAFLERRHDVIWVTLNTMFSVIIGLFTGFIFALDQKTIGALSCSPLKFFLIFCAILYVIISVFRIKELIEETNDFEVQYLVFIRERIENSLS